MASTNAKKTTPQMNKKARAKLAKDTINTLIPHIIKTNERARRGVSNSQLIRYNPSLTPKRAPSAAPVPPPTTKPPPPAQASAPELPQGVITPRQATRPRIHVIKSDTFDAAHSILISNPKPAAAAAAARKARIAVLNMASPLRPGGGVLNGAMAQEESLCTRSTLYASLRDEWYRLPEDAIAYSPDVLVFRASSSDDDASPSPSALARKEDWWYVDVISCAALRFPETQERQRQGKDGDGVVLERAYADDAQREAMARKVRAVVQVAAQKAVTHLVLGALGCGAYGNPPREVAEIFRRVLCGDRKGRRSGVTVEESGIEEVVFAIFDEGENLRTFTDVFADVGVGEGS